MPVCKRCGCEVENPIPSFRFYYCPECKKDLFSFEVEGVEEVD